MVTLSLQLRNTRVDVDRLTIEVRSEREKVSLYSLFSVRVLLTEPCADVLTSQQVQRVKSAAGKLLKVRCLTRAVWCFYMSYASNMHPIPVRTFVLNRCCACTTLSAGARL